MKKTKKPGPGGTVSKRYLESLSAKRRKYQLQEYKLYLELDENGETIIPYELFTENMKSMNGCCRMDTLSGSTAQTDKEKTITSGISKMAY